MSAPNVIAKNFGNFKGLDLRSSDLQRSEGFCSDMLNAIHNKSNVISKRKGYKQKATSSGGHGLDVFANLDLETGIVTEELISIGEVLYKKTDNLLNITYAGSGAAYFSVLFIDTEYIANILVDQVEVLSLSLGTGRDEASVVQITALSSAVDALADFTSTITGSGSVPAAFLESQEYVLLESGILNTFTATSFEAVNSPQAIMFTNTQSHINDDDFINASIVNAQNVLFIGTGYDDLMKYDGQNLYKAGMPQASTPVTTPTGDVTTINNSSLKYITMYIQKDAKGNITEGIASSPSSPLNITNDGISATIDNVLAASGFNTNCAVVNGAQSTINTITVDSGHTIKVGDVAYFKDSISASFVEREVSAVAATTITVEGAAVTVLDNAVISNNLKIALYRNIDAGSTYSLVAELPNNSFSSTQVYIDIIEDAALGAEYVPPIKPHGLPPKGRFLNYYRNQLFIADNLNTISYSDIDGPEYFPPGDQSFDVFTNRGDHITGLGSLPNLFVVLKDKSIHAATGDFSQDSFRVDQVNKGDIGCIAHHTVKEVNGSLFFLSEKGVFSLSDSAELKELSYNIDPEFTKPNTPYNLRKAVSVNWLFQDLYIILLSAENEEDDEKYLDISNSKIFAYDYIRSSWFQWDNINFLGGIVLLNNVAWFSERRFSVLDEEVVTGVYKFNDSGIYLDYIDHDTAINFSYSSSWESGGQPSLYKKFLRLKMYSLEDDFKDGEIIPFSVDVSYQFNYIPNDIGSSSLDFTGGGLGYGDDAYSDDAYGSSNLLEVVSRMPATKCRSLRLIMSNNTILENILVSGYEFEITVPYQEFIKE